MNRVLFLSCNTGEGHNSCARALSACFTRHGCVCDIADSLLFISEKASKFICSWHVRMYRSLPRLYKAGYSQVEGHSSPFRRDSVLYEYLTSGSERLYEYIVRGGYDAVVCTHIFPALALTDMLEKHPMALITAFVGTDYTCSPGTADSDLQYYFIADGALTEEFVRCGVPRERIVASGLPAGSDFYRRGDKDAAKRALGISPEHKHLLLMCGSMGCGPILELTETLAVDMKRDEELTVICGTNEKLYEKLAELPLPAEKVHVKRLVEDMPLYLRTADVYMTKPGGLSTTEAAAAGVPMVLIDAVAGCEQHNLTFFTALGGALTADTPQALAQTALELLRDEPRRARMTRAFARTAEQNPAERIYEVLSSCKSARGWI